MDDVNFLRTHAGEVDEEVVVDSANRCRVAYPHAGNYVVELPTEYKNVIDMRLKLCQFSRAGGGFAVREHCRVLKVWVVVADAAAAFMELELPVGAYSRGLAQLATVVDRMLPPETTTLSTTTNTDELVEFVDDCKLHNVSQNVALRFEANQNHPRLCRLLGLNPHADFTLSPGQRMPYASSISDGAEYAILRVASTSTGRGQSFVVPLHTGVHTHDQNTVRPASHPDGVVRSLQVSVHDRDGELITDVENHWFVLQLRRLSLEDKKIPLDFVPRIAADGYDPRAGLSYYNNNDRGSSISSSGSMGRNSSDDLCDEEAYYA